MITTTSTHHLNARPHRRRILTAPLLVVFGLVLAACGSSGADTETATADPTASEQPDAVKGSDSPVENLLGVPIFDGIAMEAWFNDLSREVEAKVALCMRSEGFDYTPAGGAPIATVDDAVAQDSLEYAQTRGFGIVADFNEAAFDPARHGSDENASFVASLADAERDAYYVALRGSADFDQDEPPAPDADGGCVGDATDEVFSVFEVFDAIGPTFDGYYDLYISDSRIMETTVAWQRCMSEKGYLNESEDELFEEFYTELDTITSAPDAFNEIDIESLGVAPDASGGFNFHPGLTPDAQTALDELGEREIDAAVANWECIDPHREVQLEVQREYEEQFVAEVGPQVAAIRE